MAGFGGAQTATPPTPGQQVGMANQFTMQGGMGYRPTTMQAATMQPFAAQRPVTKSASTAATEYIDINGIPQPVAQTVAGQNLNPYLNPYTQNVIDTTLGTMDRGRQMAMMDNAAAAQGAGAFGGSRHGLVEAETNRGFLDQVGAMSAGLNQANFGQALNTAGQDVSSMNNMGQFNAGNQFAGMSQNASMGNQANQFNAAQRQQMSLANQAAQNNMRQFNTLGRRQAATNNMNAINSMNLANMGAMNQAGQFNSGARMQAGSQMGNLAGQNFGMRDSINNTMLRQGTMQQAMMQQLIDATKGQVQGFTNSPTTSLTAPLAALGGIPSQGQTATQTGSPGLFGILGSLAAL